MNEREIVKYGFLLLDASRQVHAAHLVTEKLPYHETLKKVYEGLEDFGDQIVEAEYGLSDSHDTYPVTKMPAPGDKEATIALLRQLSKLVNGLKSDDRGVNAILDNVAGAFDSWVFLLKQC